MSACSLFIAALLVASLGLLSMAIYLFVVSACTALDRWYRRRTAYRRHNDQSVSLLPSLRTSGHPRWAQIVATCAYLALWLVTAVYGSSRYSARSTCEEWISPGSHPTLIDPSR